MLLTSAGFWRHKGSLRYGLHPQAWIIASLKRVQLLRRQFKSVPAQNQLKETEVLAEAIDQRAKLQSSVGEEVGEQGPCAEACRRCRAFCWIWEEGRLQCGQTGDRCSRPEDSRGLRTRRGTSQPGRGWNRPRGLYWLFLCQQNPNV